ncbi:MAG TPA: LD-carboxypeptidase [Blastocatellia bacterium]|nr:LD-carboxypeptidase [Blastocatellia bacterium]
MRRRKFLAGLGAAACLPLATRKGGANLTAQELLRPKALRPGDTVGLITPSTSVPDPDRLLLAERTVKYFGLRPRMGKNVGRRSSDYKASVDERLDDLHAMFRDAEVKAIFAVRGGYGAAHLLDRVDYDLIRRHPKIFLGYSDVTALHLAINKRAGLVTFHGPVAVSSFTEYTQQSFRKALFETTPAGKLTNPPESNQLRPEHTLRTIRPGKASGPLIGGNLTLISTTLGTPYEIDTRGRILFLEDVDEEPYRIDRMLTQLRLAGKLDEAAGIVFGECENCRPREYKPSFVLSYSLGEVLDNLLGGLKIPVLYGLTVGHTDDQLTLPLGVTATLDADSGTLELKESGVV